MIRKITTKISLIIALLAVSLGLSACGTPATNKTAPQANITVNYNQNTSPGMGNGQMRAVQRNNTMGSPRTMQS